MIQPPLKINNSLQDRQLRIQWRNEREHIISHQQLRTACRCASCRSNQFQGKINLVPENICVEKINNLGQGLQLVFSDGHERGIFPWQYLFDLGETISQ